VYVLRVALVDQWNEIVGGLPERWGDARLRLTLDEPTRADQAAALLGPAQPYRSGRQELRFFASRGGAAPSADALRRLLQRLDRERIRGRLELVSSEAAAVPAEVERATLAESWAAQLERLPPDWSDVYAEVELVSTDYLERAAVLMAPLNPRRDGGKPAFRFRCARTFGYGASPEMVRRCLERCDAERMRGGARILRVLSDTDPVHTQGPVWHLAGRTV
jgi:hypothetical protein